PPDLSAAVSAGCASARGGERRSECVGFDVETPDEAGNYPALGAAPDDRHPYEELTFHAPPRSLALDGLECDVGRPVEPVGFGLGREREAPHVRRGVEAQLLDPREPAARQESACDRVDMTDELVAEPQDPLGSRGRVLDDLGPAQIGKLEPGVERGI